MGYNAGTISNDLDAQKMEKVFYDPEKGTYEQLYGFKNFVENDQNGIRKIAFDNFTKKIENYDLSSLKTLDNDKAINDPSYLPSKVNPDILKLFDDVARNYNGNKSDKEVKEYSTKLIIQYVKILKGTSIYIQKMIEWAKRFCKIHHII